MKDDESLLSPEDVDVLLSSDPIGRQLQEQVLDGVEKWMRDDLYHNFPEGMLKYTRSDYEVIGTQRKNAVMTVGPEGSHPLVTVIYLENYRCFQVYTARTLADVCICFGITPAQLAGNAFPDSSMFPRECFAYTANNIADSINAQMISAFGSFKKKYTEMSASEMEKTVNKALDGRDFSMLQWIDNIKEGMELRVPPAVLFLDQPHRKVKYN